MIELRPGIQEGINGTGVEEAVVRFFDGARLTIPGHYTVGEKQIDVVRDEEEGVLSATTTLGGIERAVIRSYYRKMYAAYFRLLGEEIDGERDEVVYNRWIFSGGTILLARGPGLDLRNKRVARNTDERLEIAGRLGIELNAPPHPQVRIYK